MEQTTISGMEIGMYYQRANAQTILFGTPIPKWKHCPRCGAIFSCRFNQYTYEPVCDECKLDPEYQKRDVSHAWKNGDPFKNKATSGVFEGKGTRFYTNWKGDVIKTESSKKPVKLGR